MRWGRGIATVAHGELLELLASCYTESLTLAVAHGVRTIAFPAISCGIYGYPISAAAEIAVRTVAGFLAAERSIEQVVFACFGAELWRHGRRIRSAATGALHCGAAHCLS